MAWRHPTCRALCEGRRGMLKGDSPHWSFTHMRSVNGVAKSASWRVVLVTGAVCTGMAVVLGAAELKPHTIAAFDRYVAATEARMQTELAGEAPFLWVDRLPDDDREQAYAYAKLRAGEVVIDRLETRDGDEKIKIPDGKIHHWIGTVLIPGVTLAQTMALVRDYDRYAEIYSPDVRQSKLLRRDGSRFRVYLQLFKKNVVTVVLNTEYDAEFVCLDDQRVYVPSYTTRILEVEHPDTPDEREKPEGRDRGFMWRFYNYCSYEERAADTYMQCESITLTRGIPFFLNVFIRPFVNGIPKEGLTFNLEATRRHLTD